MSLNRVVAVVGSGLLRQTRTLQAASNRMVSSSPALLKSEPAREEDFSDDDMPQFGQTRVGDILSSRSTDSFWCQQDDLVIDAVRKMAQANVGSLLVCDPAEMRGSRGDATAAAVVGIITERDYLNKVVVTGQSSSRLQVSAIMTPQSQLRVLTPEHSVLEAMELMVDNNVRHVPVVDKEHLLGMLSIRDVVKQIVGEHREQLSQLREYISGSY